MWQWLKPLKFLLYPFSILYGAVIWLRNRLYDTGFLSSIQFDKPVICVGNLSTGGTGKTPHIEYLIQLLNYQYRVATMSRGYKRNTKGFKLADSSATALSIGDEPLQYFNKFDSVVVSVCEDRMTGIPQLLHYHPEIEVILLDDAFQHRSVKAGLNILITDYAQPFYNDYILPFGNLRESRKSYQRADVIIVSKCPELLTFDQQKAITKQIKPFPHQSVFFSRITYSYCTDFFLGIAVTLKDAPLHCLVVAGIAKPEPMVAYLKSKNKEVHLLEYPDHHYFTTEDLEEIKTTFDNWKVSSKTIITTEKDAMRLQLFKAELAQWGISILVLPIQIKIINNEALFSSLVTNYVIDELSDVDLF